MRAIDADALRDEFDPDDKTDFDAIGIRHYIASAPTIDAAPVVRCGECIGRSYAPSAGGRFTCKRKSSPCRGRMVFNSGYCDQGRKMDKEEPT